MESSLHNLSTKKSYPAAYLRDNSWGNYERKRKAFTKVKNLTLITPSVWLADLVKQSFLKEYPVKVQYNKINTEVFKPTQGSFREKYGLTDSIVVLGVASIWDERKGLDDFFHLSEYLDEHYKVVIVGLNDTQMKKLPSKILGIQRTDNLEELAEIYTAANVLFNPTYEDNYPTVNLEAEACGTKVITYDTGGASETIHRSDSIVIPIGAYEKVLEYI